MIIEVLPAAWGLRQVCPQTTATWNQLRGGQRRITFLARQRAAQHVCEGESWAVGSGFRRDVGPSPGASPWGPGGKQGPHGTRVPIKVTKVSWERNPSLTSHMPMVFSSVLLDN